MLLYTLLVTADLLQLLEAAITKEIQSQEILRSDNITSEISFEMNDWESVRYV